MEPRISSLIDDSLKVDRGWTEYYDPVSNKISGNPTQLPLPAEPGHAGKRAPGKSSYADGSQYAAFGQPGSAPVTAPPDLRAPGDAGPRQGKSAVPIAEVLNVEKAPDTTPKSLSGILSEEAPKKKRKVDGNELLTLPKPQPQVKKSTKRQRIPPLLQGLHQPPPNAGLFPPITGDGFQASIKDRTVLESPKTTRVTEAERPSQQNEGEDELQAERRKPPASSSRIRGKRRKWTEQETKDLLTGVARFGIGSWKKILQCPDFEFNSRTAVDLKDRFRTCCPKDYRSLTTGESGISKETDQTDETDPLAKEKSKDANETDLQRPGSQGGYEIGASTAAGRKKVTDLASIGIDKPFFKRKRRDRCAFSEKDDEALLLGFQKYGPRWNDMKNDPDFSFAGRHPTDLRDRFRNRFPDKYAEAGYKIKLKDHAGERNPSSTEANRDEESSGQPTQQLARLPATDDTTQGAKARARRIGAEPEISRPAGTSSALRPLITTFPELSLTDEGFPDFQPDEDRSPITLNRNIFQWADANPASSVAPGQVALQSHDFFGVHPMSGIEQLHVNPLATTLNPAKTSQHQGYLVTPTLPGAQQTASGGTSADGGPASGVKPVTLSLPPPSDFLANFDPDMRVWDDATF